MLEITTNSTRTSAFQNMINVKFITCAILSICAALGTIPYGYQFAQTMGISTGMFAVIAGTVFAAAASIANTMLGTYSLLNIKNKQSTPVNKSVLVLSSVGSIPYGFLCYYGYADLLPFAVNTTISIIVVIVNAGIGYTAISNLLLSIKDFRKNPNAKKSLISSETVFRVAGFTLGLAISLVTYLAASDGITGLLIHFNQTNLVNNYSAGYILAILSWLPCAALFANANQIVAGDLYKQVANTGKMLKSLSTNNVLLLLFCLASGTAIAQMTASSFGTDKSIPDMFKTADVQFFVQHYLITMALLSSAALNYFSIKNLMLNLRSS